jgi:predicted DNA-binding transcriptional regulator YafY
MPALPSRHPKRPPRPGRPTGRFTQHRRIDKLRELLESEPRGLTLEELATTLRITDRSVRRYLRELDASTALESIETTPGGAHLWRIKPSERGRAVPLRRAQAYAILASRRALEVLKGSALFDELDIALGHIEKIAETPFRTSGRSQISGERHLEARFFVVPPPARSYATRGEDLDELFRAVADLRVLRFRPRTRAGEPRAERVTFLPYAMVVHKGSIVVLGARRGAPDVEGIALEAMTDIRTSETEHFELPSAFDVGEYVHGELGIGRASKARAIIEFDARVADEIRSKKLHPQQKLATSPDGRVRVQLPLIDVPSLLSWVLSYGDAARVVDPPELVRSVGETLARAAARYDPTT